MASWRGRGKGRAGGQPQLTFQSGPGKGSGRPGAQPQIQPAIVDGQEMTSWVGRGGGRSPSQPRIQSASVIAAQRGIQQAASNIISGAVGAVGGALGGFMGQPAFAPFSGRSNGWICIRIGNQQDGSRTFYRVCRAQEQH